MTDIRNDHCVILQSGDEVKAGRVMLACGDSLAICFDGMFLGWVNGIPLLRCADGAYRDLRLNVVTVARVADR